MSRTCKKLTKNRTKILVFTTLDILKLKKLRIMKIFTVKILCICFVNHANRCIEEKNENKYLIFDSTDENKELLKKYSDVWSGIKNKIEAVSCGGCDYEKDYVKIKFNSDDGLPLNKPLKFNSITITIRFVFEEDGKLYLQVFLDDALHELSI